MEQLSFSTLGLLLFIASLVTMLTRKFGVPYSVGLVIAGITLVLPASLTGREEIITIAFAVVAFSTFAQGLTMPSLMRRLGLIEK